MSTLIREVASLLLVCGLGVVWVAVSSQRRKVMFPKGVWKKVSFKDGDSLYVLNVVDATSDGTSWVIFAKWEAYPQRGDELMFIPMSRHDSIAEGPFPGYYMISKTWDGELHLEHAPAFQPQFSQA